MREIGLNLKTDIIFELRTWRLCESGGEGGDGEGRCDWIYAVSEGAHSSYVIVVVVSFIIRLVFKKALLLGLFLFCLLLLHAIFVDFDSAELLQRMEDILFAVFHLDGVYYLLNLGENVVVLCFDASNYVFSLEKQRSSCSIVEHSQFFLIKA